MHAWQGVVVADTIVVAEVARRTDLPTWSWIALAQASQLSQAVPQDVARPFAPQLPQVVPQVQAQALARRGA